MTSNRSRSRVLNLIYRLVNSIEGNNAHIERSSVYKYYHANKYSIKVFLKNNETASLKTSIDRVLNEKGFHATKMKDSQFQFLSSPDGVSIRVQDAKDVVGDKYLDIFIF